MASSDRFVPEQIPTKPWGSLLLGSSIQHGDVSGVTASHSAQHPRLLFFRSSSPTNRPQNRFDTMSPRHISNPGNMSNLSWQTKTGKEKSPKTSPSQQIHHQEKPGERELYAPLFGRSPYIDHFGQDERVNEEINLLRHLPEMVCLRISQTASRANMANLARSHDQLHPTKDRALPVSPLETDCRRMSKTKRRL